MNSCGVNQRLLWCTKSKAILIGKRQSSAKFMILIQMDKIYKMIRSVASLGNYHESFRRWNNIASICTSQTPQRTGMDRTWSNSTISRSRLFFSCHNFPWRTNGKKWIVRSPSLDLVVIHSPLSSLAVVHLSWLGWNGRSWLGWNGRAWLGWNRRSDIEIFLRVL